MEKSLAGWSSFRVSNLEIESITEAIMSLSLDEIDELWMDSGWIDSEAENDGRNALPNWRLEKIKKDKRFAEDSFISLVMTPIRN